MGDRARDAIVDDPVDPQVDLQRIREGWLQPVTRALLALGGAYLLLRLAGLGGPEGLGRVDALAALCCAGLAALTLGRASASLTAACLAAAFLVEACRALLSAGFAGTASLFLVTLPVFAVLFFGRRAGYAFLAGALALFALGAAWHLHGGSPHAPSEIPSAQRFGSWVRLVGAFGAVVAPVTWLVATVTTHLDASLEHLSRARSTHDKQVRLRVAAEEALQTALEQRRRSRELESAGLLISGVVHDLRNAFSILNLTAGSLKAHGATDEATRDVAKRIEASCARAGQLTTELLAVVKTPTSGNMESALPAEDGAAAAASQRPSKDSVRVAGDQPVEDPVGTHGEPPGPRDGDDRGSLRAQLALRVSRRTFAAAVIITAIAVWQYLQGGATFALVAGLAPACAGLGVVAYAPIAPRLRVASLLAVVAWVTADSAVTLAFVPGSVGGGAVLCLLGACLVSRRATLALLVTTAAAYLFVGALQATGLLAVQPAAVSLQASTNWLRTSLSLAVLMLVPVTAMLTHLDALAESVRSRRALLRAAVEEEVQRQASVVARGQTEAEHRRARGIAALGQLGDGFADDCDGVLHAVRGEVELLARRLDESPAVVRGAVPDMREALDGAAAVLRRLLILSGRELTAASEPTDVRTLLRIGQRQLQHLRDLAVVVECETSVSVLADAPSLHAVLLNLALNARDAMGGSGTLRLRGRAATTTERTDTSCAAAIEVIDTGAGMDGHTLSRLFEPLFTTKGEAGTGLGLAGARRIVEAQGGRLFASSAPGLGTTFTILLPHAGDGPASATVATAQAAETVRSLAGSGPGRTGS